MPAPRNHFAWCLLFLANFISGSAQAQSPAIELRIAGLDGSEIRLTAGQWAALPHETIEVVDHGGSKVHFAGVPAGEVLKLAGAPLGKEMRGANLALYVVAEARDGYRVVYALSEFDSGFRDVPVLVADKRDGQSLAPDEGPLRIVVPGEKRQGRWTRQLVALRLRAAQ
jgi:hypothetical protein